MVTPTNTFVTGTGIVASPVNVNFEESTSDITIYTGTAFNASQGSSTGTTTNSYTASIGAGVIKRYVKIHATLRLDGTGSTIAGTAAFQIETAENAGAFTSRYNELVMRKNGGEGTIDESFSVVFFYEPTAGEKTNGLDIRFTGTAVVGTMGGGGDLITIANIQTTMEYI